MCYIVNIAKVEGGDLQMFLLQKKYCSLNNVVTCFVKNKHDCQ